MRFFALIMATFFYFGKFPFAPGTFGTLGGVLLYFLLQLLGVSAAGYAIFLGGFILFAVWVSTRAAHDMGEKDPSAIVIDEVAGFLVTMYGIPHDAWILIPAFILNRILDIYKPFPAKQIQDLKGGWGIVLDDVVSSFYANLLVRLILLIKDSFF
jgi:phosphatidylglycerophosphatase A